MLGDINKGLAELERQAVIARNDPKAKEMIETALGATMMGASADTAFFVGLATKMDLIVDRSIPTAATDGKAMHYNPDYIVQLTPEQCIGLVCHEALHKGLLHPARMAPLNHEIANVAADWIVNEILKQSGIQLPDGALYLGDIPAGWKYKRPSGPPPKDADLEGYYQYLCPPYQRDDDDGDDKGDEGGEQGEGDGEGEGDAQSFGAQGKSGKDPGKCGAAVVPGDGSESAIAESEAQGRMDAAAAEQMAKGMGNMPAALQRLIDAAIKKTIPWQQQLQQYLIQRVNDQSSWKKPNKRLLPLGIYLPGRDGRTMGRLVFVVDQSGSVDDRQQQEGFAEIRAIVDDFPKTRMTILYHDVEVHHVQEYDPRDGGELELSRHCSGGTSHIPVFNWIDENCDETPTLVICFTDMVSSFPPAPDYPVLWLATGSYRKDAPFGELIHVPTEGD